MENIKEAIYSGFEEAEEAFLKQAYPEKNNRMPNFDKSGSCALVNIICENLLYIANLGDSRCIISEDSSRKVYQLTKDHKPEHEKERIESNGGDVYK